MWWFHWLAMRLFRVQPVRLVAPHSDLDPHAFDGLIIGGGDDIAAEIYKGEPTLDVRIDPERDAMELALLRHGMERGTPVLGVCRGAQMLNAYYGGSLHQDMRAVFPEHPDLWSPLPRKRVRLEDGSRIAELMKVREVSVNSLHRQAIDRVGSGLRITGRDEYGTVQSIEDPEAIFRVGVQWHPEFLIHHRTQRRLFRGFVEAVRRFAATRPEKSRAG
jgi:putative glutamine amidotransferase